MRRTVASTVNIRLRANWRHRATHETALLDHKTCDLKQRWLELLTDYWLSNKPHLCGREIVIADDSGSGLVTLGGVIRMDFSPHSNVKTWTAPAAL